MCILLSGGCGSDKKYLPEKGKHPASDHKAEITRYRQELYAEFRDPETSPLTERDRKVFNGLDFFEPDSSYRITARLVRTPDAVPFLMPTTTERTSREVVYGILYFELQGKAHSLEVYRNLELSKKEGFESYLFLPFLDDTNGEETYGGGRYLDLEIPAGDSLILDFNRAYNPYCAYNKKYSCPLVPAANRLHTAVRAGLKNFKPASKKEP